MNFNSAKITKGQNGTFGLLCFNIFLEILGIVVLYNRNAMLYAQSIYTVLSLNFAIYFIIYAI